MIKPSRLEIIRPRDLTAEDERLWNSFVAQRPDLAGPYFDVRYIKAIGCDVPRGGIARFYDCERIVGYFPFQIRLGVLQPMGAPLSDYHGIISEPGVLPDFDLLLTVKGVKRLEFQGWVGPMAEKASTVPLRRRVADTSQGFAKWWATQNAEHHKFFKNIGRCQRNVVKDFGGFEFTWEKVTPELLGHVLDLKRLQYRKSGMHDVFNCGWTRTLLENLARYDDDAYGLRAGVFRHEGRLVAAEISLMGKDEVHLWFPAYDPTYYRYSVGILLTVAILEYVSTLGITRFDFGTGGEDYKSPLTIEAGDCAEGDLAIRPPVLGAWLDRAAFLLPVKADSFAALRQSIKRRLKLIRATELGIAGWSRAIYSLTQRSVMRFATTRSGDH